MSRKEKTISIFITLIMVVFAIIAPGYFSGVRSELKIRNVNKNVESFQGVITVWHIVGFKPYSGSLGGWLSKCGREIEDMYSGVFLEIESITEQEANNRISRGERADIYSFPLGWAAVEQLRPLENITGDLRGNLMESGEYCGEIYGQPYAASGCVIAVNSRYCQENGLDIEHVPEMIKSGQIQAAGDSVAGAVYGAGATMLPVESFTDEQTPAAILDARTVGDMVKNSMEGNGFPYAIVEYCNYSAHVQMLGISRYAEEGKINYTADFIRSVMQEKKQKSLEELGLIPAIEVEYDSDIWLDEDAKTILKVELKDISAPNSFLYGLYKDQLEISAAAALEGDDGAKKDFDLRIRELVRGAQIK